MYILQFQINQFGLQFLCVENGTAQQFKVLTVFHAPKNVEKLLPNKEKLTPNDTQVHSAPGEEKKNEFEEKQF